MVSKFAGISMQAPVQSGRNHVPIPDLTFAGPAEPRATTEGQPIALARKAKGKTRARKEKTRAKVKGPND